MNPDRARAILADHVAGLHDDHDDPTVGCRYPGCEDAYWLLSREIVGLPAIAALIGDDE